MKEFYVYIYLDIREPCRYCFKNIDFQYKPVYIGKGSNKRYLDHLKYLEKHPNNKFKNKLKKILSEGFSKQDIESHISIIPCSSEQESFDLEVDLIKSIGIENLCNLTAGGEGISGYKYPEGKYRNPMQGRHHSEETIRIMSEIKTGKRYSLETRKKISLSHVGKKLTKSHREKISKSNKLGVKKYGEESGNHKLTTKEVIQIKMLIKLGFDNRYIQDQYFIISR